MNPAPFPILLIGNMVLLILIHGVLPRWIVTGPDKRQLRDDPKLKLYLYGIIIAVVVLLIVLFSLNLSPVQLDLSAFALVIGTGLAVMFLEKKHLPNTRRHLVTLCWIGGICILAGIYTWATY